MYYGTDIKLIFNFLLQRYALPIHTTFRNIDCELFDIPVLPHGLTFRAASLGTKSNPSNLSANISYKLCRRSGLHGQFHVGLKSPVRCGRLSII